jgi:hypothetical protein
VRDIGEVYNKEGAEINACYKMEGGEEEVYILVSP